jgi:hypothetical protein
MIFLRKTPKSNDMKSQFYTNVVLSLITLLLAVIVFQNFSKSDIANNVMRPVSDVRIVSIVKPNKEKLEEAFHNDTSFLRWDHLPITGSVDVSGGPVNVYGSVSIDGEVGLNEPISVTIER